MDLFRLHAPWFLPLVGLGVDVLGQILLSRLPLPFGQVRRQFLAFAGGLAAVGWLTLWLRPGAGTGFLNEVGGLAVAALTYAFLGFVFFNALNANLSSLRVRVLRELLGRSPTGMTPTELEDRYGTAEMLAVRLERLTAGGQLRRCGERYRAEAKGVSHIGHFFAFLQRLLLKR